MIPQNQQLQLTAYDFSRSTIQSFISNDQALSQFLTQNEEIRGYLNVKDVMESLCKVGNLLTVAYAGTHGFTYAAKVLNIKLDYQTLIHDSTQVCNKIIQSCIQAMKNHQNAIKAAKNNDVPLSQSLPFITRCQTLAKDRVKDVENLRKKVEDLCKQSKGVFAEIENEKAISFTKRQEINDRIRKFEAKQDKMKSQQKDLAKLIDDARKTEQLVLKEAATADRRAFAISVLSTIIPIKDVTQFLVQGIMKMAKSLKLNSNPKDASDPLNDLRKAHEQAVKEKLEVEKTLAKKKVELEQEERKKELADRTLTNRLEIEIAELTAEVNSKQEVNTSNEAIIKALGDRFSKQAETLRQQQAEIAKRRFDLEKTQMEINADMAEATTELKNASISGSNLDRALHSLQVAIHSLGIVQTMFESIRDFWQTVQTHCESLEGDLENSVTHLNNNARNDFIECLNDSGFNWFTLGKINYEASLRLENVKKSIDKSVSNLPNLEESKKLVAEYKFVEINVLPMPNNNNNNNDVRVEVLE